MALGVVITDSISSAVSAQGNMTACENLGSKVMSLTATAKIIDDKRMFIVSCPQG
jgi:hypothetical protein